MLLLDQWRRCKSSKSSIQQSTQAEGRGQTRQANDHHQFFWATKASTSSIQATITVVATTIRQVMVSSLEVNKAVVNTTMTENTPLPITEVASTSGPTLAESPQLNLLLKLQVLTANLPLSVPIGCLDEPLACFAVNPRDLIQPGQDAWEDVIDPTFN